MTRTSAEVCTPREKQALAEKQHGLCGCGCGAAIATKDEGGTWKFAPEAEFEHTIPTTIKKSKPDAVWLKSCHAKKTSVDRKNIAKCKRLAGEHGQAARRERKKQAGTYRGIAGRGFQKPEGFKHKWPSRPFER